MSQQRRTASVSTASIDPERAWQPYVPSPERPWDLRWAGHLWRRAANGATWSELQDSLKHGPQATVDRLLEPSEDTAEFEQTFGDYEAAAADSSLEALQAWWLRRMIETPDPLRERLTLFWHGHLAISNVRVKSPVLMNQHVQMLRQHALGDYRELLADAARDPVVFLGLNAQANRKSLPNDFLGRHVLDRWTLGPGTYRDEDVHAVARAWTGWFVLRNELKYFPREFDKDTKTILGSSGEWNAVDSLRIALQQPAAPRLIVRKLYRWFVCETDDPDDAFLGPLYVTFGKSFNTKAVVEQILRSNHFFSPAVYRRRVKGPVEYAVGLIRAMKASVPTVRLAADLGELGQRLFAPPTLQGWPSGRAWINPATLVARANLAAALLSPKGPYGGKLNPAGVAAANGCSDPDDAARFCRELLLQDPAVAKDSSGSQRASGIANESKGLRDLVQGLAASPEFQLS